MPHERASRRRAQSDYSRFGRSPDNRFQWHRHAGALSNEHEAEWWGNRLLKPSKFTVQTLKMWAAELFATFEELPQAVASFQ